MFRKCIGQLTSLASENCSDGCCRSRCQLAGRRRVRHHGGLGGEQCVHFRYSTGAPGSCQPGVGPGWHTFDGVWGPGYISAYIDGVQVMCWISSSVTSVPMEVLFDMTTGTSGYTTGQPSTMWVSYVRIWLWQ